MARKTKSAKLVKAAFHEVKHNPPKTLTKKGGQKQRVAIALNKARAKGARIPRKGR